MYEHKSAPGRKHYVVYTDLRTGEKTESPTFANRHQANAWIHQHVQASKSAD